MAYQWTAEGKKVVGTRIYAYDIYFRPPSHSENHVLESMIAASE
jgi:hypothetical protein